MADRSPPPDQVLDARGLRCPLPVIRTEAMLRRMRPGEVLKVLADDPVAAVDIPHFCREAGHGVTEIENTGAGCVFLVTAGQKNGPPIRENP